MQFDARQEFIPERLEWTPDSQWVFAPKQGRSRDKMAKVLSYATMLFREKGFDETSISELSRVSGVAATAIYRRFKDKRAILYSIFDVWQEVRRKEADRNWSKLQEKCETPDEIIIAYVHLVFSHYLSDSGLLRIFEVERIKDKMIGEKMSLSNKSVSDRLFNSLKGCAYYKTDGENSTLEELREAADHINSIVRGSVVTFVLNQHTKKWPEFGLDSEPFRRNVEKAAIACLP